MPPAAGTTRLPEGPRDDRPPSTVFLLDVDNTLLDNDELQRLRGAYPHESHLLEASTYVIEYPFAERVYAGVHSTRCGA